MTPHRIDGYPQLTGCNLLQFNPSLALAPSMAPGGTTQADEPSGYTVDLKAPQSAAFSELATPELRNATVTLPEGVSLSPSAADGLLSCAETGPEGIDMPQGDHSNREAGEGEAIGADGVSHLTPGHCPPASQVGTVEITTPLLSSPLEGHVYVAQPQCGGEGQSGCTEADATNGNLFGLYLEAAGSGVNIKLKGKVAADPHTGRLTATFQENPEVPFSDLKLQLDGGPRAPLANPQSCGSATTTSDLEPWSGPVTPDGSPSSSFCGGLGRQRRGLSGEPAVRPGVQRGTVTPRGGRLKRFDVDVLASRP